MEQNWTLVSAGCLTGCAAERLQTLLFINSELKALDYGPLILQKGPRDIKHVSQNPEVARSHFLPLFFSPIWSFFSWLINPPIPCCLTQLVTEL